MTVLRSRSRLKLGELRYQLTLEGMDPGSLSDGALLRVMDHLRDAGVEDLMLVPLAVDALTMKQRPAWVATLVAGE